MNIFVKNLVSVPFVKSFKAATENCEFYNFSYAKKKNLKTLQLQRFGFLQICKVQVAHHVQA